MIQLDFFREWNPDKIIKKIAPYSYVSFDIFDTLLKRDILHPTEVFQILGKQYNDSAFMFKRIEAERNLREQSGKEEITLDDIYEKMEGKYQHFKMKELELEADLLHQNFVLYPVYQYCKEKGKKIIITSDMYLPEPFLRNILNKEGYEFDFCFISSSYGVQKVTGNLFKKMLSTVSISSKDVIHIGDSVRGDYLGAKRAGIQSILIPKVINRTQWINLKDKRQQAGFNNFINNHLNTGKSRYAQFGYAYFGPVLFGFVQWLHKSIGNKKIFFFARDGYLVKKVYDALFPESSTDYIYLSRRALSVPLLWKHSEWEEFSHYITVTRFFTVRSLLERLGLNPERYKLEIQKFHLQLDSNLQDNNFLQNKNLKAFYKSIREDVVQNSREEFVCLIAYFKKKNFYGDIAVMDIGWNGSMQRYLVEIMNISGIDARIDGYYFGMRKNLKNSQVHGYFYEPSRMQMEPIISFMQGLFESLFLSREGSTKRYDIHNGKAEPVLYEPEYHENDIEFKAFQAIQEEALCFCKEYSKSPAAKLEKYKASEYSYNLLRFSTEPTLREAELFGNFRFYDTNVFPLAKPRSLLYYVRNPKIFSREFSYSAWKAGFMKRCFKINIPYMQMYMIAKVLAKRR